MSASDQMRAMLDELMGTARTGEKKFDVKFDDHRVCKSFLLGCCPNDLLSATRMDMGDCGKIHEVALRADYEKAAKTHDYFYDVDAAEHLLQFIAECDRKTEQAKRRLKETQEELSDENQAKINVIHGYGEQIGTKLARAEELGAQGNVEESLKLMEEVDELKKQKHAAEMEYRNTMPASNYQQQKLRVCEVCSAFLGIHDNDRRLADHFGGKLHVGFITLRGKLAELQVTLDERRKLRDAKREAEREEYRRSRSARRSTSVGRHDDDANNKSSPSRKRDEDSPSSSRRRRDDSRERRRSRSGSRRRRRDDSRERSKRRSRSRSRSHKSKHSRKSRSRSRSRRSRSGSRHRRRGSSRDRRSSKRRTPSPSRKDGAKF